MFLALHTRSVIKGVGHYHP